MSEIPAGTPRYFAWLYGDARLQALLAPLFGIETEINAALQPALEHSVAHARMAWWAEEAQRLRAGHALHPLSRALLAQWPAAHGAAGPDVSGLVENAAWDLASAPFETRRELALYCERWARPVIQLAAAAGAADLPPPIAQQFGLGVGAALCELDMLISLPQAARLGRLRLPLDELAAVGVDPAAVAHPPVARGALRASAAASPRAARRARVGLRAAALAGTARRAAWSAGVGGTGPPALAARGGRAATVWRRSRRDGLSDAWRAWRAARRAMRLGKPEPDLKTAEPQ